MEDLRSSRACCGLVPTAPTEDALRTIFVLSGRGDEVSTSALARHLGVAPPTVSVMLKRLAEHGLVERTRTTARRSRRTAPATPGTSSAGTASWRPSSSASWGSARTRCTTRRTLWSTRLRPAARSHRHPARPADARPARRSDPPDRRRARRGLGHPARRRRRRRRVPGRARAGLGRRRTDAPDRPRRGTRPDPGRDRARRPRRPVWVRFDGRDHAVGEPLARLVHGREVPVDVHR